MFSKFFSKFYIDILPTLPLNISFWGVILLFLFAFFPSYIVYAKQSVQRKIIYLFSLFDFVLFFFCIFVKIEDFYFDRGDLTIFAKSLYVILFIGAIFDADDKKSFPYKKKSFVKKYIQHPMESFISHFMFVIFRILPVKVASGIGGFLGRMLGKTQKWYNFLMDANLSIAFPRKRKAEKEKIKTQVWDMMGRYVSEPAHFKNIYRNYKKYLTFENDKILDKLNGKPYIAFIAHCGSLGLISIPFALHKADCSIIYKYPSNNLTNNLVIKSFGNGIGKLKFIPNTANGTKDAMKILSSGGAILAVPDQKFQTGIETKFFGQPVKSPVGVAKLAGHFNYPILPVQLVRVDGVKHKIIFHEPFMPFKSKNKELDAIKTMQKINDIIEGWIKENPSQWFWVHDRWGIKEILKKKFKGEKNATKNNK